MNSGLVLSEVSFFVDVELNLLSAAGITILAFDEDVEFVTVVIVGVLLLLFFLFWSKKRMSTQAEVSQKEPAGTRH